MFRVGQKVVCVEPHDNPPASGGVIEGKIYTIRELGLTQDGAPGVRVCGLKLSSGPGEIGCISLRPFVDVFMKQTRFRPIVSRKTDISCFTVLLNPSKERENV